MSDAEKSNKEILDVPDVYFEVLRELVDPVQLLQENMKLNKYSAEEKEEMQAAIDYLNAAGLMLVEGVDFFEKKK